MKVPSKKLSFEMQHNNKRKAKLYRNEQFIFPAENFSFQSTFYTYHGRTTGTKATTEPARGAINLCRSNSVCQVTPTLCVVNHVVTKKQLAQTCWSLAANFYSNKYHFGGFGHLFYTIIVTFHAKVNNCELFFDKVPPTHFLQKFHDSVSTRLKHL